MKTIFLTLRTALMEIPALSWVDKDKGQIDKYAERPPVSFPCALIKISLTGCEDLGGGIQHCKAACTVRLAFDFTGETSNVTPDEALESSLAYFDLAEAVYKKLQGFSTEELGIFSRRSQTEDKRTDGLLVLNIPFETEFDDYTAEEADS